MSFLPSGYCCYESLVFPSQAIPQQQNKMEVCELLLSTPIPHAENSALCWLNIVLLPVDTTAWQRGNLKEWALEQSTECHYLLSPTPAEARLFLTLSQIVHIRVISAF